MSKNKIHTFYITESQRNNTAYLLGVAISKLREERHDNSVPLKYREASEWMIADAENLQAFFELQHPGKIIEAED